MREDAWIDRIRRWTAARAGAGLVAGIGDDCAVLRPAAGRDLLVTTDLMLEGVHLRRDLLSAQQAGAKAAARGLSDIAAMGGDARFLFLSLAVPAWADRRWVRAFFSGLTEMASRHGVRIAGGDLTRAEKLAADVVVLGDAPRGKALRRDGARAGDVIYVSGALGRAAAAGFRDVPEPRLELGRKLRGRATACIDLSDGLALDLHRVCKASGTCAELDGVLPTVPEATLDQALFGGEDYELLCTLPAGVRPPQGLERIGVMTGGRAKGEIRFAGRRLEPRGWDPFRQG
ncbi:MAG: thiamine-phosphate kinase [Bryobacteraceae bacterium]|nr:thiamine-phosphate kinase [Bryobacteraceae bacterium]